MNWRELMSGGKIISYLIFESTDRADLIQQINTAIRERDWIPQGGICVTVDTHRARMFYQAMVQEVRY
jgi:hypothetical protein